MKKTTTPCISLQGSSARERRYSSIAVGFPIRNDQKAHYQRVSRGFPSWVGTRSACTYVKNLEFDLHSTEDFPPYSLNSARIRPTNCRIPHYERPKKDHRIALHIIGRDLRTYYQYLGCTLSDTRLHHAISSMNHYLHLDCTSIDANQVDGGSLLSTHQCQTSIQRTTHEYPTNNPRIPNEQPTNTQRTTHEYPTSSPRTTHECTTNTLRTTHEQPTSTLHPTQLAVKIHLWFTCGSLGSHLTQLNTHPAPVYHTIRANSKTYPGSFKIH